MYMSIGHRYGDKSTCVYVSVKMLRIAVQDTVHRCILVHVCWCKKLHSQMLSIACKAAANVKLDSNTEKQGKGHHPNHDLP